MDAESKRYYLRSELKPGRTRDIHTVCNYLDPGTDRTRCEEAKRRSLFTAYLPCHNCLRATGEVMSVTSKEYPEAYMQKLNLINPSKWFRSVPANTLIIKGEFTVGKNTFFLDAEVHDGRVNVCFIRRS